jgi:MFS family permease
MIVINTTCNILGTFLWGFLAQKFGNITTISIVVGFGFVSGIFGFFSQHYFALVVFVILVGLSDRGMETIIGPALVEIYGLKSATMLLPVKGFCLIIGFLIAPIFQILTSSIFNPFQ